MGFRPRSDVVFLTDHSTDLSVLQPKSPHMDSLVGSLIGG